MEPRLTAVDTMIEGVTGGRVPFLPLQSPRVIDPRRTVSPAIPNFQKKMMVEGTAFDGSGERKNSFFLSPGQTTSPEPANHRSVRRSSMRRFRARAAGVSAVSIGWNSPKAVAATRFAGRPFWIISCATAMARAEESSQFVA